MIEKYSTITDFIKAYEIEGITYPKLFYHEILKSSENDGNIIYRLNADCILDEFSKNLEDIKIEYTMTDDEFRKYKYNPKAFSYYLYGTTEFWHLLLDVNEMYSAIEFDRKELFVYDSSLSDMVSTILKASKTFIDENESEVTSALLS